MILAERAARLEAEAVAARAQVRGRVKVDPFDGPMEFFLKYNGAYAWAPYFSSLKRKLRGYRPSAAAHMPSPKRASHGRKAASQPWSSAE